MNELTMDKEKAGESPTKLYNMNCLDYLQSEKFAKDVRGGDTYYCH